MSNSPKDKDNESSNLKIKNTFKFPNISKMNALCLFRNYIVFYDRNKKSIESVNLDDMNHKVMHFNFPEINMFISNNEFLACILKDGVIYKL